MARERNPQNISWLDKFAPSCGLIGSMIVIGCFADIYFTYHFEWDGWLFGLVYTGILVPGKAAKILSDYVGKKR